MDNITRLIEALEAMKPEFEAANALRAYHGIIITAAQTFPGRRVEFNALLPTVPTYQVKKPVKLKSLGTTSTPQPTTTCATCGKGSTVPQQKKSPVKGNILRLEKKPSESLEVIVDFAAEALKSFGQSMEEVSKAFSFGEGTGVSPASSLQLVEETKSEFLTGETVLQPSDWAAVLQEVKTVEEAKTLYKTVTGKNYHHKSPQELDQICKAIWEARKKLEE